MKPNKVGKPKVERDIVLALLPFLKKKYKPKRGQAILMFPELSVDNGITDIVLFVIREKFFQQRIKADILTGRSSQTAALLIAPLYQNKVLEENVLHRYSNLPYYTFKAMIKHLLSTGAVIRTKPKNTYRISSFMQMALENCIAVEAKVKDWRGGLYQATRHTRFANKTFLAIDSRYIHRPQKHIKLFHANRVGLIEVNLETKKCKIIVAPVKKNLTSLVGRILANEKAFTLYRDNSLKKLSSMKRF
jgi:predicted transcriptional regulator